MRGCAGPRRGGFPPVPDIGTDDLHPPLPGIPREFPGPDSIPFSGGKPSLCSILHISEQREVVQQGRPGLSVSVHVSMQSCDCVPFSPLVPGDTPHITNDCRHLHSDSWQT